MKLQQHGFFRFEFMATSEGSYNAQRFSLAPEFGKVLPSFTARKNFGQLKDIRILCKPVTITEVENNSEWNQVRFNPLYVTDGGSSPDFLRSIIDNDNTDELRVWLLHDRHFSLHDVSRRKANRQLAKGLRAIGTSRVKCAIAWLGVSSATGRRRWKRSLKRKEWTLKTTEVLDDGRR